MADITPDQRAEAFDKLFEGMDLGPMNPPNPKDRLGMAKPPISLIPPSALIHIALAMKNGADKYGAYNWRANNVQAMIYVDAAMRHLIQWIDGEEDADDSGVHHLAHAAACCAILLDAIEGGNLIDNRPIDGPAAQVIKEHTST
jgi:hypothetical protein